MQSAERAGAIGLVQVRDDDVMTGRTAIISGIPGLELTQTDGRAILDAVAEEGVVVGYGTPPEHAYSGALDALAAALEDS
jgi:hypothetical protein